MYSKPQLLQGVFPFEGKGLHNPVSLGPALTYEVPVGKRAQLVYFRGGNSEDALVYVVLTRDGKPLRYFPLGAKSDAHVPLAVTEDLLGGTVIEAHAAAPEGVSGTLVLDIGLVEI